MQAGWQPLLVRSHSNAGSEPSPSSQTGTCIPSSMLHPWLDCMVRSCAIADVLPGTPHSMHTAGCLDQSETACCIMAHKLGICAGLLRPEVWLLYMPETTPMCTAMLAEIHSLHRIMHCPSPARLGQWQLQPLSVRLSIRLQWQRQLPRSSRCTQTWYGAP